MDGGEQAPDDRPVRARRGDARAYESLVQEHQAIAFRTAYLITGSAADAEEAAQEAFVRAWLALKRFRQGAEFRPWLLAIVANEARNRVRNRRRREGLAERAAHELTWQAPSEGAAVAGRRATARGARRTAGARSQRARLPLRARSRRAGDRGRARRRARHRQVANGARARAPARRAGGGGMTLERDLRALAAGLPDAPDLSRACSWRVREASARRRRRRVAAARARASSCSLRPPPWRSRPTCATACSRPSGCAASRSSASSTSRR